MKIFSDEQKLREFTTNRRSVKELLKCVLCKQEKRSYKCFTQLDNTDYCGDGCTAL